jgi:hypothetical protein
VRRLRPGYGVPENDSSDTNSMHRKLRSLHSGCCGSPERRVQILLYIVGLGCFKRPAASANPGRKCSDRDACMRPCEEPSRQWHGKHEKHGGGKKGTWQRGKRKNEKEEGKKKRENLLVRSLKCRLSPCGKWFAALLSGVLQGCTYHTPSV